MSRVMRLFVLTSLLVLALTPLPSSAQTGLATVTGLVTDNTGAAVPGVAVTATNQGTNVDYTGVSNEAGAYVITGVPIGTYVVRSELTGFKTVQSNVSLSAGQTARVDFKLEVGAVEERIEVAATGAVLQTENAVVGQTLQREQVEKLPIQGRNLATATLYAAGVTTPNPVLVQRPEEHGRRPSLRQRPARAGQQLHARRRRHERRHRQPDRVPAQPGCRRTGQRRDQQLLARARQRRRRGRQHGDQVRHQQRSAATRFYYWRDNDMAATPWAINRAGGRKAEFNRKIFGGTVGGPIAQNKVFFFADYQGGRQKSPPADEFSTVIPDEWRRGDLSSLLNRATPIVVRDPVTRQPFPNNQIPTSRFSQFARNLLARRSALPARQRHALAGRLPPELRRQGRLLAGGEPVRRQGGLERVDQRQGLRPLLEAEPPEHAGSHVDAAAVRLAVREPVLEHRRQLEPHHRHDVRERPADRVQRQQLQRHARST